MKRPVCPQCDARAEIRRRFVLASTDGPVEHCAVTCADGHCFALPAAQLATAVAAHVSESKAQSK